MLRGEGGGRGRERKKWGKNNFLESPPNPSPKISDIPSANVLIRGETSLFHGAIFHALTNQPVREPGVVRRGLWRGGWGLLGRGPGQGVGGGLREESTGREPKSGRQNLPRPHSGPEHSPCHPWACQVDGRAEGQDPGWDQLCLSLQGLVCGRLCCKVFRLSPWPLFSCPPTFWIVIQTSRLPWVRLTKGR